MSKPISRIIIQGLVKLHHNNQLPSSTRPTSPFTSRIGSSLTRHSFCSNGSSNVSPLNPQVNSTSRFVSEPTLSNVGLSQPLSSAKPNSLLSLKRQFFSTSKGAGNLGKRADGNLPKKVLEKPLTAVSSAFFRYREAIGLHMDAFWKRNYLFLFGAGGVVFIGLHMDAFWKRNYLFLFGAGGVVFCVLLWRIMFGIANTFVGLSEGMAKYGFLAVSSSMVAFAGLYIRSRYTINPDKVYRMAMRRLNTSAGILEVMGAPLSGTDLRAYVMSGGGLRLQKFKPSLRSKRCFLIFPIQGSERKGLVSVEVKKKKGQYDMKLLAVDIPMASGPDQRFFLIGDEEEYKVGGGLISELRDPVVKAMAASKEFDDIDRIEEQEEAERKLPEAERNVHEETEKLEKGGS